MEETNSMDFQKMWFEAKRRLSNKANTTEINGTGSYKKSLEVLNEVEMDTVQDA